MQLTPELLARRRDAALAGGDLDLPAIGGGDTAGRWHGLSDLGRDDLSYARLVEPHVDALAILDELQHPSDRARLHAVWASGGSDSTLRFVADDDGGGGRLVGRKAFCSGAELCDVALVTAPSEGPGVGVLARVDLHAARSAAQVRIDASSWRTPAFAATGTATVTFDSLRVGPDEIVGSIDDYLDRPGFWHGAIGPAAVWAGGLLGLVDAADAAASARHAATLGHLHAACWSLHAWFDTAGREIDRQVDRIRSDATRFATTDDELANARRRAIAVRHLVQRCSVEVVDRASEVLGPRGMAFDEAVSRRLAEVQLYVRQFHGADELVHLSPRRR